jgi:hypothetical protein
MNKNVYIIYPPGYSGNYINWAITKSNDATSSSTIDNPINTSDSKNYGGAGTSHLFHRFPTHAGIKQIMFWLISNQPKEKQVYIINACNPVTTPDESIPELNVLKNLRLETAAEETMSMIMNFDRDPVIIHITSKDEDYRSVSTLNGFTKWPIFYKLQFTDKMNIDLSYIKNNFKLRNFLIKNYNSVIPKSNEIIFDENLYKAVHASLASPGNGFAQARLRWKYWFETRNKVNPHEVNEEQFILPYFKPKHFYSIDISEIYQLDFISKLENIINQSDLGKFNFEQAYKIHPEYVKAQKNLVYLDEIKEFRITKKLTKFLKSNSITETLVIREVLKNKNKDNFNFSESQTIEEILEILRD